MMKFNGIIMLCITFLGFFACLSSVSAADVSIDNNTWAVTDIQNYFNGMTVHGLTISNGDNVIFQAGDYLNLALTVKNSVNILANGAVNFIGKGATIGITVSNVNNVNITGLSVSNYTYGIYLGRSNNTDIVNNTVNNNRKNGITLDAASNTDVINNTMYNNTNRGIYLSSAVNSSVSNNIICNSLSNGGIVLATSINSYLVNNTLNHNVDGIYVYSNAVNTTVLGNVVSNDTSNGIVLGDYSSSAFNNTVINNTVNNNNIYGIRLINTVNSTIAENNVFNNTFAGIGLVYNAVNSNITENNVSNNRGTGIGVSTSSNSTVRGNTVNNNKGSGITLSNSVNSTVGGNVVSNNSQNGIIITGTGNSTVKHNTFSNNTLSGVRLANSGNSVTDNSVTGNSVGVSTYATNNAVNNNNITNNGAGILIGYNSAVIVLGENNLSNNLYGLTITGNNDRLTNFVIENNTNGIILNGINNILNNVTSSNNTNAGLIFNSTSSGSLFTSGSVTNSGIGIVMNGQKDSVLSSTILKNTGNGFTVNGFNNTLNYNRIYQNNWGLNNTGSNTNANLNWWGINNAPTQITNSGTNLNMIYWYVLQLSANNFNTTVNATQTLNAGDSVTLGYSLETNVPVTSNKELLPYFKVTITKPDGSTITGDIRNTAVSYTSTAKKGTVNSIQSTADNENIRLSIDTPTSDLAVNKTVNNKKPPVNDKIVYTITVTNNGPDNATDVFVKDLLPKGLKFISADGRYNPSTGLWSIGDLQSGETAVLNIIAQVIQSNANITNTATVYQTNYDPNNTNDQSDITINVGKDSDPTSGGRVVRKDVAVNVNAETVTMKNTGVPVSVLVLGILAVFGGMLQRRK
ncbi:Conserved repeat domain protein [Methanobacterium congolense]|uniref:Conserved repeat domain protein n=2 Tax=Methanobacterium congolense TaxID=118062 RepID=A0A1D3L2R8_9EURY|nr:Conserved repeat domain protein [Methanobacterium congolense]